MGIQVILPFKEIFLTCIRCTLFLLSSFLESDFSCRLHCCSVLAAFGCNSGIMEISGRKWYFWTGSIWFCFYQNPLIESIEITFNLTALIVLLDCRFWVKKWIGIDFSFFFLSHQFPSFLCRFDLTETEISLYYFLDYWQFSVWVIQGKFCMLLTEITLPSISLSFPYQADSKGTECRLRRMEL